MEHRRATALTDEIDALLKEASRAPPPPPPPPCGVPPAKLAGSVIALLGGLLLVWMAASGLLSERLEGRTIASASASSGNSSDRGTAALVEAPAPQQAAAGAAAATPGLLEQAEWPPSHWSHIARDMLPWMRQRPAHAELATRWGLPTAPALNLPPTRRQRIPRILHHIFLPDLPALLKLAGDPSKSTKEYWGHGCALMHTSMGWEHYMWDQQAATQLISKHYSAYLPMWQAVGSVVQRADMLKYFLMHAIGGMYMDLDVECWRPVDPMLAGADVVLQSTGKGATNGQFAAVPRHPVFQAAIDIVHAAWKQKPKQEGNSLAGPPRMRQAFFSLGPVERKGQADPWAGTHQINGTVLVHAVRTWYLICHYNEPECHRRVALQRAVGAAPLATAAGYHRYTGSWAGGNGMGIHTWRGFLAAVCPRQG